MKKIISILFILVLGLSLVACGGSASSEISALQEEVSTLQEQVSVLQESSASTIPLSFREQMEQESEIRIEDVESQDGQIEYNVYILGETLDITTDLNATMSWYYNIGLEIAKIEKAFIDDGTTDLIVNVYAPNGDLVGTISMIDHTTGVVLTEEYKA